MITILAQAGSHPLGAQHLVVGLPEGLLLDEAGGSVKQLDLAPSDLVTLLLATGLATAELAGHHTNHTLSNLVACLVATDIMQVQSCLRVCVCVGGGATLVKSHFVPYAH